MPTLTITDFSCIREASFTIAPVTVIIGPQGSGKSVTTKLTYFFADILSNFVQAAERGDNVEAFKSHLNKVFSIWFPPSAWGQGRFNITYTAGPFYVRLLRRTIKGKLSDVVAVTFSEWFTDFYEETRRLFDKAATTRDAELDNDPNVSLALDRAWRLREVVADRIARSLRKEFLAQQTFIPAGRAFFTSIGRLVAGFEQAGSLDPVTVKFARLFANLKDRHGRYSTSRLQRLGPDFMQRRSKVMGDLFGGEIKFEDEVEYVQTSDGRKVPFSFLSSGQQELLPMWSLIDYFNEVDALRIGASTNSKTARTWWDLVYIEEPEAHLFPSAQSLLMEFLIGSIRADRSRTRQRSLILTTHSPYIMSKLNVFLKAGQLAKRKKRNQDINEVVPRECWLADGQLAAYAIENGRMRELLDDEGLIDSTYLDQISEDISRDFSALLSIEAEVASL